MATNVPFIPFPSPPKVYDIRYMSELTRVFTQFQQQVANPGPVRADVLTLTNLPVYANNAAALAGDLAVGDVYRTSTGELRIVI
jgi:hypothetical protein